MSGKPADYSTPKIVKGYVSCASYFNWNRIFNDFARDPLIHPAGFKELHPSVKTEEKTTKDSSPYIRDVLDLIKLGRPSSQKEKKPPILDEDIARKIRHRRMNLNLAMERAMHNYKYNPDKYKYCDRIPLYTFMLLKLAKYEARLIIDGWKKPVEKKQNANRMYDDLEWSLIMNAVALGRALDDYARNFPAREETKEDIYDEDLKTMCEMWRHPSKRDDLVKMYLLINGKSGIECDLRKYIMRDTTAMYQPCLGIPVDDCCLDRLEYHMFGKADQEHGMFQPLEDKDTNKHPKDKDTDEPQNDPMFSYIRMLAGASEDKHRKWPVGMEFARRGIRAWNTIYDIPSDNNNEDFITVMYKRALGIISRFSLICVRESSSEKEKEKSYATDFARFYTDEFTTKYASKMTYDSKTLQFKMLSECNEGKKLEKLMSLSTIKAVLDSSTSILLTDSMNNANYIITEIDNRISRELDIIMKVYQSSMKLRQNRHVRFSPSNITAWVTRLCNPIELHTRLVTIGNIVNLRRLFELCSEKTPESTPESERKNGDKPDMLLAIAVISLSVLYSEDLKKETCQAVATGLRTVMEKMSQHWQLYYRYFIGLVKWNCIDDDMTQRVDQFVRCLESECTAREYPGPIRSDETNGTQTNTADTGTKKKKTETITMKFLRTKDDKTVNHEMDCKIFTDWLSVSDILEDPPAEKKEHTK